MATALTIAGLDPSGGAGVIADVRAFNAFECSAAAAITSITFQNEREVLGANHLSSSTVRLQVLAVLAASAVAAVKTGMLPTASIVREVVQLIHEQSLPAPIVDPVMRSTSGYRLIEEDAIRELLESLLPVARLVTPNIPEAEHITGVSITDVATMAKAAHEIRKSGAQAVLIKGGHLDSVEERSEAIDLLDNEGRITVYRRTRIPNSQLHGSGCLLSAAIAACLAHGKSLEEAVDEAKQFVANAIFDASRIAERLPR